MITTQDVDSLCAAVGQQDALSETSRALARAGLESQTLMLSLMVLMLSKGGDGEGRLQCLLSAWCVGFEMGQAWSEKGQLEGMMGEDPA